MSNILQVKNSVSSDDSITSIEFHSYAPFSNSFNHSDEIRIAIQAQDIYILPCDSYLFIEYTSARRTGVESATAPTYNSNFGPFLFSEIRYEINGMEVDKCKNPGITSTMKGVTARRSSDNSLNDLSLVGYDIEVTAGTRHLIIPMNKILGFFDDYKKVRSQTKIYI